MDKNKQEQQAREKIMKVVHGNLDGLIACVKETAMTSGGVVHKRVLLRGINTLKVPKKGLKAARTDDQRTFLINYNNMLTALASSVKATAKKLGINTLTPHYFVQIVNVAKKGIAEGSKA